MIVKNPTNTDLEVQIDGNVYSVEANGETAGVPAVHATRWQAELHNFITLEEEEAPVAKAVKEVKEVVEVPVVVETPAPKKK